MSSLYVLQTPPPPTFLTLASFSISILALWTRLQTPPARLPGGVTRLEDFRLVGADT